MKSLRGRRREGFQRQYPMWNCLWLPSKWKVISAVDPSIKCKKVGMKGGIMPTKSLQTGWRRETFQAQHPMWNCSWLPWKEIIISAMGTNMKCEKAGMEEGIMPIKFLWAGWRRLTFQTPYPMVNCSWLPAKSKITSVMDTSRKCKKSEMEEGAMPIKYLCDW